ncbi:MAG: SsrA-binding protein SmpB [Ignavibacteriales bacterium]|nr:SsrA-binding protein SmpB [Ignavibacteriales bacterium]
MALNRELQNEEKTVVSNRRALHDYFVTESYEAGIELKGTEVKSLRAGKASLQESYAVIENGEVWLLNSHINPFEFGNINNHEPLRKRRLLLNSREIFKLKSKTTTQGYTLIPLRIYFKNNRAKVELAVAKGKHHHDKREAIKEREVERDIRRKFAN